MTFSRLSVWLMTLISANDQSWLINHDFDFGCWLIMTFFLVDWMTLTFGFADWSTVKFFQFLLFFTESLVHPVLDSLGNSKINRERMKALAIYLPGAIWFLVWSWVQAKTAVVSSQDKRCKINKCGHKLIRVPKL